MKPTTLLPLLAVLIMFGSAVTYSQITKNRTATLQQNKAQASNPVVAFETNSYVDYTPTAQAAAQQQGMSVLFFAATTWCQSCSAFEEELVEKVTQIPSGVTILKVDYDNDEAMNKKYGVTAQHTLIVLDKSGAEVTRWVGGDFERMLRGLAEI